MTAVDDGRCQGLAVLELLTGRIRLIAAKAVILCTGGAGRVFPFTTPSSAFGRPWLAAPARWAGSVEWRRQVIGVVEFGRAARACQGPS